MSAPHHEPRHHVEDDDEPATMRPSGASIRVDPGRLRAALEMLATGDGGDDPSVLLGFVQLMMARACSSPTGFESWLEGSLVVSIRRRTSCGVSVHVAGDADGRVDEAFAIPFARLPFGRLCGAIDREPAVVGPAFVYVTDDEVSISVITYVDGEPEPELVDDDGLDDDRTVIDLHASRRTQADGPTVCLDTEGGYDPDATMIASPPSELLRLSRHPKATPGARRPRDAG
jgi:hypothetical protein